MYEYNPEVNPAAEFLEISNDFTDPKEIIREAISNAFDAGADDMSIEALIDKSSGDDELVLIIKDNGNGMDENGMKAFFGLGFSTRRTTDQYGHKATSAIGEKGHGTKIYFNSRRIEIRSVVLGKSIEAFMDQPRKTLRRGEIPKVEYNVEDTALPKGTEIKIIGYNDNNQTGFSHDELQDYIFWFTKFGSPELQLEIETHKSCKLKLRGLGRSEFEPLEFGHRFPEKNTEMKSLKTKDKVSPLDYYVAKWVFRDVPVIGMPNSKIDFVFFIEGDQAKRKYNAMVHQRYASWLPGQYNVEQRYGLWLSKDYIPITRNNDWIAEKSEWTKYHAFVNSQDFRLTANRGDLNNTPTNVMEHIKDTVKQIFVDSITPTPEFKNYRDELERQQQYRSAVQEEKDFDRRKTLSQKKKVAELDGHIFMEPRQEGGVFSLFLQIITLKADLFDFKVVDYDTSLGYDLLVTKDYQLDLNRASLRFVEMKYELKRDFNHSFKRLAAIICWNTNLTNDDEVQDLTGAKRRLRITAPNGEDAKPYTKYMLVSDDEPVNIEVYVLKEFLKEKLDLDFKTRTKEQS